MKNKEVLEFAVGLSQLRKELTGRLFTHAVVLNRDKLEMYVKALEEARKPSEAMQEYLDKFEEFKKEFSTKDEDGNPILKERLDQRTGLKSMFYDIPDNNNPGSQYSIRRTELFEETKEVIEEHNKMITEWVNVLLEEVSEFDPTMISLNDVPVIFPKESPYPAILGTGIVISLYFLWPLHSIYCFDWSRYWFN